MALFVAPDDTWRRTSTSRAVRPCVPTGAVRDTSESSRLRSAQHQLREDHSRGVRVERGRLLVAELPTGHSDELARAGRLVGRS